MTRQSGNKSLYYLAYSLPVITTIWLITPIAIVQGIYAKYFGLSLSTIAGVILFARLFDAITDPLVGYYCDQYSTRLGSRKPIILVGGILFIISSYFLYVPYGVEPTVILDTSEEKSSSAVSSLYFAAWFIAFYMTSTLFEIPHLTWASELAPNAIDKAKLFSFRTLAMYLGQLLFFSIPMLPFFTTTEITPASLQVSVMTAGFLLLLFLFACLKLVPDNLSVKSLPLKQSYVVDHSTSIAWRGDAKSTKNKSAGQIINFQGARVLLQELLVNPPFMLFIGAFFLASTSVGMWYGLIFIYVDVYLGMGEQFAPMFMLAFLAGIFATPIWGWLSIRLGKKTCWLMAITLLIASYIFTASLKPSETDLADLVALKIINTLAFVCIHVIAPAIVSEVSDYAAWKNGVERPASYFALYYFTSKTAIAISTALGLAIAGWYGFDTMADKQTETSVFGITLAIVWVPIVFATLALGFVALTPINERRHFIIHKRLHSRKARMKT